MRGLEGCVVPTAALDARLTATTVTLAGEVDLTPYCAMCQTFARRVTVFGPGKFSVALLCKICAYNAKYFGKQRKRHVVLCDPASAWRWSVQ